MIKDEEIKICKDFLKDKECEMCKKFILDCKKNEGIYKKFMNRKMPLPEINEKYISKATAIIRTHPVCQKHFRILKKDNDKRHIKNIEITESLNLLNYRRSDL